MSTFSAMYNATLPAGQASMIPLPLRCYSAVVKRGLILPKKILYTKRDVDRVLVDSLFRIGATFTKREAKFIVRCSAVFHSTDYSRHCRPTL
jgi:hypothetical protein